MDDRRSELALKFWRGLVIAVWSLREILRTAWRMSRGPIIFVLQLVAALVVLFEEWGWKPLSGLLARLAQYGPVALIERWIAGLPPYGAIVVFALPTLVLLPLKFAAMWLLALGRYWTATALFAGAKVASTALVARLFTLTKPQLMRIAWFARAYEWFVPWKDYYFTLIRSSWVWRYGRMVKNRVRIETKQIWLRMEPHVRRLAARLRVRAAQAIETARDYMQSRDT